MNQWNKRVFLWVSITMFLTSCGGMKNQTDIGIAHTPIANFNATATSTKTVIPTLAQPTSLVLPTVPTLSEEEAYALLFDMLKVGSRCEFPCWLNIIPGVSTNFDAYKEWGALLDIASNSDILSSQDGYIQFVYNTLEHEIFIDTSYDLSTDGKLIESMSVWTQVLQEVGNSSYEAVYDSTIYKDILDSYLLSSILTTYGSPAQTLLSMEIIEAEPTSPDYFYVWLLYPATGAIIQFKGEANVQNGIINGCPFDTFIAFWLVSPDNAELYQDTLEEAMGLPSSSLYYKSTEDAIGMTSEEFYNEFKVPSRRCIESPLNIWPEH